MILGFILLVAALVMVVVEERTQRAHRRWCASRVQGEGAVTRIGRRGHLSRNEPTSDDRFSSVSVVTFTASNGVAYEFDAPDAPREVGKTVRIAYDAAMPSDARLVQRTRRLGCAFVFAVVGAALLIFG